jgi:hypothetical protein
MEIEMPPVNGETKPDEEKKTYKSRDGFEAVPLVRGFTEIEGLYNIITFIAPNGAHILGGYARYCASPKIEPIPASDVDIYCHDEEVFQRVKYFFINTMKLTIKHENPMAISFRRPTDGPLKFCPPVQIIKPVLKGKVVAAGDLETILSNFDFTIIRAGLINKSFVLVDADFLHDEAHMFLRIKNIHCPISSTLRFIKYAHRGYFTRPMQVYKLFRDWEGRGNDYREKLAEFLEKSERGDGMTQEEIDQLEELMRID